MVDSSIRSVPRLPRRDVFNPSKKGGASVLSPCHRGRWNVQTRATRKVAEARRKKTRDKRKKEKIKRREKNEKKDEKKERKLKKKIAERG